MQQQRPQTSYHSSSSTNQIESPAKTFNMLTTLQLSTNRKLLEQFPKDAHADVVIQVKNKRFELQKAHLRIESPFFDCDKKVISIQEYDPDIFEGILKCFYGGQYIIYTYQELYLAYQICSFIKCEGLCKQIESSFIINKKSFTLAFQLSELYGLEDLRVSCYEFLDSNSDAFLQLFDLGMLKLKKNHKKTTPSDILGLNKTCFIHLVQAHNTYKKTKQEQRQYLTNYEMYQILELYNTNEEDLKEAIVNLIDRNTLTSEEYYKIYHQLACRQSHAISDEPHIQPCHQSVKEYQLQTSTEKHYQDYFDVNKSENYYFKKRMTELEEQNKALQQETQKLQIALETSMKNTNNFKDTLLETITQKLDNKLIEKDKEIENLRQELQTLKSQIFQKDQTIIELEDSIRDINDREIFNLKSQIETLRSQLIQRVQTVSDLQYSERDFNDQTLESINQNTTSQFLQQQELAKSEFQFLKPQTVTQSQLQLTVQSTERFQYDAEPVTLDKITQLNYMFDHLKITIFSQIYLRRLQLGSLTGYDTDSFKNNCSGVENLLILIRVFDYNKIIGILIYGNEKYLLNISNRTIQELDDIILFEDNIIEIPGQLTICSGCDSNTCYGQTSLTGNKEFIVEDVEAYSIEISHNL
ncbi:unnamed protein product [Paramecium primaurelia]|uniref:BTB domain-containing protein n=1 Tax=Paramecium primaurelia TaxID=5886 RepID=A0A8S1LTR1_PARPR|nr:unnamed protein product [Paramecium primaurelia]